MEQVIVGWQVNEEKQEPNPILVPLKEYCKKFSAELSSATGGSGRGTEFGLHGWVGLGDWKETRR